MNGEVLIVTEIQKFGKALSDATTGGWSRL